MQYIKIMKVIQEGRTYFGHARDGLFHSYIGHQNPVVAWDICGYFDSELIPLKKSECLFADEMEKSIHHLFRNSEIIWAEESTT